METEAGKLALLPDGQRVKIEIVHEDGYATVRRIDGDGAGMVAVCEVSKLKPGGSGSELFEGLIDHMRE